MRIKIKALDTLFFRDGKPFSMGEESWAEGIFPPNPSVLYGAIRGGYFSSHIEDFRKLKRNKELNSLKDITMNLRIREISLMTDKILLPYPADCLIDKKGDNDQAIRICKLQKAGISSSPCAYIIKTDDKEYESIKNGYINLTEFKSYLKNSGNSYVINNLDKNILNESKIGIARDQITKTAENGMLYRVEMKRLENLYIVIDFEGIELPAKGFLKLGGEGKAVSYTGIEERPLINLPSIDKEFIMYLSTPGLFKNGWLPGFIDEKSLEGEIVPGLHVKLKTAILGRPELIGGFDMQAVSPKVMRKAVPAGSIYYFEIINGDSRLLENQQGKSISDYLDREGFGIVYYGKKEMGDLR